MDLLQKLKLRNLFGQGNAPATVPVGQVVQPKINPAMFNPSAGTPIAPTVSPSVVPVTTSPLNPPDTGLAALRRRATPDMDAYRAYLGTAPNKKDHQLSKLGKALAFTSGVLDGSQHGAASGMRTAGGILNRPWEQAQEQYAMKGGNLKELADLEYRGGTDDTKLEVAINNERLAQQKANIDLMKADSSVKLNDARMAEIADKMALTGQSFQKNEADGQLYVIDLKKGTQTPWGKYLETAEEKRNAEDKIDTTQEAQRQKNRLQLEGVNAANQRSLTTLRASLEDKNDASKQSRTATNKLKENMTPAQRNAAFEGAYSAAVTNNPNLVNKLFDNDGKGNLTLKEDYDPKVYGQFVDKMKEREAIALGENYEQKFGQPNPNQVKINPAVANIPGQPQVNLAPDVPVVRDPAKESLRVSAIEAIKNEFPNDPELLNNPEAIAAAMDQIQAAMPAETKPFNIGDYLPANFGTYTNPKVTNTDGGLGGLVGAARSAPATVYAQPVRRSVDPRMQLRGIGGPTGR